MREQVDQMDNQLDDVLDATRSHKDEDDEEESEGNNEDNDAESGADDNNEDEREITTDDNRRCPKREVKKPDICDGQHFEKSEEIEFMESENNIFNPKAKEQSCKADEAPMLAQLTVNMMRLHVPEHSSFAQQHDHKQGVKQEMWSQSRSSSSKGN